jgi:hypothetical protein
MQWGFAPVVNGVNAPFLISCGNQQVMNAGLPGV